MRGVDVLGMHRSKASATTASSRCSAELLARIGCDAWSVPALEPGWELDVELDDLRAAAPAAFCTLRHSRFGADDLGDGSGVSREQRALYAALRAARGPHERWSFPSLPPETAWVEPLLAARRNVRLGATAAGPRTTGAFAVLVAADELVRDPSLVSGFGERVGSGPDATLVVYAGGRAADDVAPEIERALARAGVADAVDATLLAPPPGHEPEVVAAVDAVLTAEPPPPAFATLPRLPRPRSGPALAASA